jgi:ArsR family transcriptional regulator
VERNQSVEILKALADENRLAIVRKIAEDAAPTPGCELSTVCSQQLSQPTMSHHVNILVKAGVLGVEKQGTKKAYSLQCETLEAIGIDITKL